MVAHGIIIQTKFFVDIEFLLRNLFLCSTLFAKCPKFERAVITVYYGESRTIGILLNLFYFD